MAVREQGDTTERRETKMLAALTKALSSYITDANVKESFEELLQLLLSVTDSEYGFIGEVLKREDGTPYLRTHAITNIAWNDETRAFYAEHAPTGMEFTNMQTLFGRVITTGEAMITNAPGEHPARGGLPEGHPSLDAFLGLPFSFRDEMVGMVGIANRPDGYDETIVTFLQPLLTACAQLIYAQRVEREREVAREREARAMEALERSHRLELLGRLAGCVAHDFNNLLTVISGSCALIAPEVPSDSEVRNDVDTIAHAAKRATALTKRLLSFARTDQVVPGDADFCDGVDKGMQLLRRLVGSEIELVAVLAEDLGNVRMDVAQLEQLIVNLGINARDAMPEGGKLSVETQRIDDRVRLIVRDTGCGITDEVRARVFDPFFTTKSSDLGTGLGLSMCYSAVQQAGGTIDVDSEIGNGTTFVVELPIQRADQHQERAIPEPPPQAGRGQTVLVADDESQIRTLVAKSLKRAGYRVAVAANGFEAESIVKSEKQPFDLLLTDMVMPGISGRELAQRVQDRVGRVLFMSGYLGHESDMSATSRPWAVLPKPFTPRILLDKVQKLLEQQPGPVASR